MKVRLKTDAGRLPLVVTIGFSVLLHGLFVTGLPNLPWFSRPAEIFRLTRYVVRFAKPAAVPRPVATEVAVAEATSVEAAPLEPPADLQPHEPVERVDTPSADPVQPPATPAGAPSVLPTPPEIRERSAAPELRRTETQPDDTVRPQAVAPPVQPVRSMAPDLRQRTAAPVRQRVDVQPQNVTSRPAAPTPVKPVAPLASRERRRVAAQARGQLGRRSPAGCGAPVVAGAGGGGRADGTGSSTACCRPRTAGAREAAGARSAAGGARAGENPRRQIRRDCGQRTAAQTRQRVEVQPNRAATPALAPTPVESVVTEMPPARQRVAARVRRQVDVVNEHAARPQEAPTSMKPVWTESPEPRQREAAQARRRMDIPAEQAPKPQAAATPATPVPLKSPGGATAFGFRDAAAGWTYGPSAPSTPKWHRRRSTRSCRRRPEPLRPVDSPVRRRVDVADRAAGGRGRGATGRGKAVGDATARCHAGAAAGGDTGRANRPAASGAGAGEAIRTGGAPRRGNGRPRGRASVSTYSPRES